MAKGQVTEEELASGLKGIGNFGALSSPRVRRDNPFRDSRVEESLPRAEAVKTIEVVASAPVPEVTTPIAPREPELKRVQAKAKTVRAVEPVRKAAKQARGGRSNPEETTRKADIFTERVTLQISPEMRDDIDSLARDVQRSKTTKEERITANTVMRVALQLLIDNYEFDHGDVANNEAELYELIAKRLSLK